MFGTEYIIALVSILIQIGFAIVTALPFHYAWKHVAVKYFYFIPEVYHSITYWELVGVLLVVGFIGSLIDKLMPKIINVNQTVGK